VLGSSSDLFSGSVLIDRADLAAAPPALLDLVPSAGSAPRTAAARAAITEDRGHRLVIEAETDRPAVLVISDAYLPQWRATVDGAASPCFRVNYGFRGVLLDPGRHTVALSYHPWSR
jgi:hypothetical protein